MDASADPPSSTRELWHALSSLRGHPGASCVLSVQGIQLWVYLYSKRTHCISSSLLLTLGQSVMIYHLGVMKGVLECFPESFNSILTLYDILNIKMMSYIIPNQNKRRTSSSVPPLPPIHGSFCAADHRKGLCRLPCASSPPPSRPHSREHWAAVSL